MWCLALTKFLQIMWDLQKTLVDDLKHDETGKGSLGKMGKRGESGWNT